MSAPSLLDRLLGPGGLSVVFQPILELGAGGYAIHGVEALMRGPKGTHLERADILFDYVRRKGEESRVDRACVATALGAACLLPQELRLSVNVHASTLGADPEFVSFLADTAKSVSIDLARVTVEIVEHSPFWDGAVFHDSLRSLRAVGIAIALDDVGCGQSNYRMVLECRPDLYKIDRFFVHGAGHDHSRSVVLASIHSLAENLGGHAIAEGVEDATDLETVSKIGIRYVQGHFFAPARALIEGAGDSLLQEWRDRGVAVASAHSDPDGQGHGTYKGTEAARVLAWNMRSPRSVDRDDPAPDATACEG